MHTASAQADEAGGATARAGREELREAIRAARGALAAGPGADSAAVLVERLHNLHRLDREDGLGEWAATFGLLRSLRARLDGPSLSEGLRATAEAALEAEAVHLLTRGHHEEAEGLLAAWGEQVESPEVSGVLRMVEAHLTAANGEYGAASSLVASVAEAEPDEVMRRELMAVAALYAERAGVSGEGRGTPEAGVTEAAAERSLDAAEGPSLSVYPNPSQGQAVVALVLAEASEVRVAVYDVLGRRVAMLSEGLLGAGAHPFALDGSGLPAGVYLVRAEMTDRVVTRPITLLR